MHRYSRLWTQIFLQNKTRIFKIMVATTSRVCIKQAQGGTRKIPMTQYLFLSPLSKPCIQLVAFAHGHRVIETHTHPSMEVWIS